MINQVLNIVVVATQIATQSQQTYTSSKLTNSAESLYSEQDNAFTDIMLGLATTGIGLVGGPVAGTVVGLGAVIYSATGAGTIYTDPNAIDNTYVNGFSHGNAYSTGCTNSAGYGC